MSEALTTEDLAVALHVGPKTGKQSIENYTARRRPIWEALEDRGLRPIVTVGKEAYDASGDLPVAKEYYELEKTPKGLYLAERSRGAMAVGAALDTSGGFARFVDNVRALNPKEVRDLCSDTLRTYRLLGDMQPRSFTLENEADRRDLDEQLAALEGDKVVIKKAKSRAGAGVEIVSKAPEAVREVIDPDPEKRYLVQTFVDFAPTMSGVRGRGADRNALAANTDEFQMRTHTIDTMPVLHMGRHFPDDGYFSLQQDSLPEEVTAQATEATRRVHEKTGAANSYVAVDAGVSTQGQYYIVELNGAFPAFVPAEARRMADAAQLGHAIADKLKAIALT